MAAIADVLQKFLGGAKSVASSASSDADDFADFATAASPVAPSHAASSVFDAASTTPTVQPSGSMLTNLFGNSQQAMQGRPYTAWYRVWERTTIEDFYQELTIIPILLLVILVNLWGSYANKQRAKQWAAAHLPLLETEFASVGFSGGKTGTVEEGGNGEVPEGVLKQRQKHEYYTYATGRQNVSRLHINLTLHKRYNPITWIGEKVLAFFFDSMPAPVERVEATAYAFDGKEKSLAPGVEGGVKDSQYDGFVFAIVHKDRMQQLRDDRYDLSLTATRDHPKLPEWATIMSESAEITDAVLTPDLLKAVNEAGEDLEALIISDQPIDAPKKLNDTIPIKRVSLSMKLNSDSTTLFSHFLRLPDFLVSHAHFRPEALKRIKATREEESRKIRKADEDEKAEDRRLELDKQKREGREQRLKNMSAEEQKKFLEKEKAQAQKKGQKGRTMRA